MDAHEFAQTIHDFLATEGIYAGLGDPALIDDLEQISDGVVGFRVGYGGAELFDVTVRQV